MPQPMTQAAPVVPWRRPPLRTDLGWAVHNLIAHPVSELCHWLGYLHPAIRAAGNWLHDATVPAHVPGTGRG
jgi:hypothetical protein